MCALRPACALHHDARTARICIWRKWHQISLPLALRARGNHADVRQIEAGQSKILFGDPLCGRAREQTRLHQGDQRGSEPSARTNSELDLVQARMRASRLALKSRRDG